MSRTPAAQMDDRDELSQRGVGIYESRLKALLEHGDIERFVATYASSATETSCYGTAI